MPALPIPFYAPIKADMSSLSDWQADLEAFAAACDAAGRGEEAQQMRFARSLLARAPQASSFCPELMPTESMQEAMLTAGAYESAAMSLLTPGTGVLLSKGAEGAAMASVVLPGQAGEVSAAGETLALALLAALAKALLAESVDSDGFVQKLDKGPYRILN